MQNFWLISTKTGKIMWISRVLFKCNMLCSYIDVMCWKHWHLKSVCFIYFYYVMKRGIIRCFLDKRKLLEYSWCQTQKFMQKSVWEIKRSYLSLPYEYIFSAMNLILINLWTNSAVHSFCTSSNFCVHSITQNISRQIQRCIVFIQALNTVFTE